MNLLADGAHNFIDGAIIGASYVVSLHVGIATTLAVVFHEIPHELGNFFVLLYAGFTKRKALFFNFVSAVFAILGTVISLLVGSRVADFSSVMLPLAAGGFIYIAGSDLVPELNKESTLGKSVGADARHRSGCWIDACISYAGRLKEIRFRLMQVARFATNWTEKDFRLDDGVGHSLRCRRRCNCRRPSGQPNRKSPARR